MNTDLNTGDRPDWKEFEIEAIVGHYSEEGANRQYKVRWKGFSPDTDTWHFKNSLKKALDIVSDYDKHPLKEYNRDNIEQCAPVDSVVQDDLDESDWANAMYSMTPMHSMTPPITPGYNTHEARIQRLRCVEKQKAAWISHYLETTSYVAKQCYLNRDLFTNEFKDIHFNGIVGHCGEDWHELPFGRKYLLRWSGLSKQPDTWHSRADLGIEYKSVVSNYDCHSNMLNQVIYNTKGLIERKSFSGAGLIRHAKNYSELFPPPPEEFCYKKSIFRDLNHFLSIKKQHAIEHEIQYEIWESLESNHPGCNIAQESEDQV